MNKLLEAASKGNLKDVRKKLKDPFLACGMQKVNINGRNEMGETALMKASESGHLEVVRLLLKKGANLAIEDRNGETAFLKACRNGHLEVVQELLRNGADANDKNYGDNTVLLASENGFYEIVEELVENGVELDCENEGETPILKAIDGGHEKILRLLLQKSTFDVGLIDSIKNGHFQMATLLISNGANPNFCNEDRETPLYVASERGYIDVVRQLLKQKADTNIRFKGSTPLIISSKNGHLEVARELINAEANLNIRKYNGKTALMLSIKNGHLEVFQELIQAGANVNRENNFTNETCLFYAVRCKNAKMVKELLQAQAKVNHQNTGETSLFYAAKNGSLVIIKLLLKAGANVKIRSQSHETAAIWAYKKNQQKVLELLKQAGSNLNKDISEKQEYDQGQDSLKEYYEQEWFENIERFKEAIGKLVEMPEFDSIDINFLDRDLSYRIMYSGKDKERKIFDVYREVNGSMKRIAIVIYGSEDEPTFF
ncbi:ankyrin repeat and socs box protein [Anaeramoeba flamelloides]|uniref:Ankyrin repeat and socs box protein n=1 Tax=Anaeramoeba flamelloides TaxID=1746091 RepID=A0AAV7ZYJ0_9EUKA|nr:ankyrin repeat and socs box protein [Anaeramoeba flamelloides]